VLFVRAVEIVSRCIVNDTSHLTSYRGRQEKNKIRINTMEKTNVLFGRRHLRASFVNTTVACEADV
jgi:hypothetical protein